MPIQVQCPQCGNLQVAGDHAAGMTAPCAHCGTNIYVPPGRGESSGGAGKIVAIIAAVVLLVLLVCGGGVGLVGYWFVARVQAVNAEVEKAQAEYNQQMLQSLEAEAELIANAAEPFREFRSSATASIIGAAIVEFDRAHGALPAHASYGENGQPQLSWRVHLLPYLGEQELYDKFHLDEPWNSPHNAALVTLMPEVYLDHGAVASEGKTCILAAVGGQTAFPPEPGADPKLGISNISLANLSPEGARKALAFVAPVERAVTWTQPDDWQFDAATAEELFGEQRQLTLIMSDGKSKSLKRKDAETLAALFQLE